MITTNLFIEVNDASLEATLTKLTVVLSYAGMTLFFEEKLEPYLRGRAVERFAGQGDSAVGGRWKPLLPATQSIRESLGYGATSPINKRTGTLESYITESNGLSLELAGEGSQFTYPGADPTDAELIDKVATAQKGRNFPPTVARPVLGLDEIDLAYVTAALVETIGISEL